MSTYDQITVAESIMLILSPALYQSNLGITPDSIYRLSFESTIETGVLSVYQGSQLIYSSNIVNLGNTNNLYDSAEVSEKIYFSQSIPLEANDDILVMDETADIDLNIV